MPKKIHTSAERESALQRAALSVDSPPPIPTIAESHSASDDSSPPPPPQNSPPPQKSPPHSASENDSSPPPPPQNFAPPQNSPPHSASHDSPSSTLTMQENVPPLSALDDSLTAPAPLSKTIKTAIAAEQKAPPNAKRALLITIIHSGADVREEGAELSELAAAAGYFCAALHPVKLRERKAATYIGSGSITTAADLSKQFGAVRIIVGTDLSSVQARNLEAKWEVPVIDRSDLILEIFAARARTHESQLQVALAKNKRLLGRLAGRWTHLERQRGGIGLRGGPGEKQMEIDRRLLSVSIKKMERKISGLSARNQAAQARRGKGGALTAALAGYTNVGKSTLFNALTRADAPANNRLFDTLESTARQVFVGGASVVAVDTVGFIRNLPHELLAGFRATLQEAATADVIIAVADASRADCREQTAITAATLDSIGAARDKQVWVMNKIDKIGERARIERAPCGRITTVWLSAVNGDGVDGLLQVLREAAAAKQKTLSVAAGDDWAVDDSVADASSGDSPSD